MNDCPLCLRPLALSSRVGSMGGTAERRGWFSRRVLLVVAVVLLVAIPAAAAGTVYLAPTLFLNPAGDADSTGAIRLGMPVREACKELGIDAPPRAFSGTITWGRAGRLLRIRFTDGKAVAIEEGSLPFSVTVNKVQAEGMRRAQ